MPIAGLRDNVYYFPLAADLSFCHYSMNIITDAFHGTSKVNAEAINETGFKVGRNPDLFLGDGAYFYQGSQREAVNYAKEIKRFEEAVVVQATIRMGKCLDLDAWEHRELLEELETELLESREFDEVPLPFAINTLSEFSDFDTVKKTIQKNQRPAHFTKSRVYSYTRTMIAVRKPAAATLDAVIVTQQ